MLVQEITVGSCTRWLHEVFDYTVKKEREKRKKDTFFDFHSKEIPAVVTRIIQ